MALATESVAREIEGIRRDSAAQTTRVASIEILRGLVMILMALDHVRDFVHRGAMSGSPTDLSTTTSLLFMTRWVTHLCAPTFALTAGLGAWLWWQAGRSRLDLSRFLATRGLWLMLLEVTVMRFAYNFSWSLEYPVLLLVLWSLGLSMVVLAALVWLPIRVLGVLAVAGILLHPMLDGITADRFGSAAGLWNVVHQVGAFRLDGVTFVTPYPLIPWVAVVALGFSLGPLFQMAPAVRRRWLVVMGVAALAAFVALRLYNGYGDPVPWRAQESPLFTLLSFLNTTKYPASPAFLLMTLGPALLLLAAFDRLSLGGRGLGDVAGVFGRVPLFYYIFHFYLAHVIVTVLALVRYGRAALDFVFLPYPSLGGVAARFPPGFGYDLWVTYVVWVAVVAISYPLCRWYARVKARRRDWWLGYL